MLECDKGRFRRDDVVGEAVEDGSDEKGKAVSRTGEEENVGWVIGAWIVDALDALSGEMKYIGREGEGEMRTKVTSIIPFFVQLWRRTGDAVGHVLMVLILFSSI